MPRFLPSRSKRKRPVTLGSLSVVAILVAAYFTQTMTNDAAATARPSNAPSADEAAAGALAVSAGYPGGLPALMQLFDTGECAGAQSYDTASPECASILDQIAQAGAGRSFPERIPDMPGNVDESIPPEYPMDDSDQITPELLAAMEAQGAPPDLIEGLRQNPPVIPPQYNTLPDYEGGPDPSGGVAPNTVPPPTSTDTTAPPPTQPPPTTGPPPTTTASPPPPTTTDTTEPPPPTTETPPTFTSTVTTTTTAGPPPPPPPPPLLVAVGNSMNSGHEARAWWGPVWRTYCDDPGTGAAAPGSSWVGNLRALVGVPWNRYFNFAHSGASTADILGAVPYTNPCGVVSQAARSQIADARAVLLANPSRAGAANVAVADGGVNNTNWTTVALRLIGRHYGGRIAAWFGAAPTWAVDNPGACTDYVLGNPAGNATPGAPPGAIPAAWNGRAASGALSGGVASIALNMMTADPGAQFRYLLYYQWIGDPNMPRVCSPAKNRAIALINGWLTFGVFVAKIVWAFMLQNPARIQAVCNRLFNPGPNSVQMRLVSFGMANWAPLPGYPHPNAAGRATLANCVNGTLPRAPGGGIA